MSAGPAGRALFAVIDIGSNSVRLVVYNGLSRTPSVLFNEKMMAGLGGGMANGGSLPQAAMDDTLRALARFRLLCDAMGVTAVRAVATAAVREAENGRAFAERITRTTGIAVEIIDGATEGEGAALGVLAGIPDARGVIGDLGGGSLELAHVADGRVLDRTSLPLGSLRLDALRRRGRAALAGRIADCLESVGWNTAGRGLPFYAVGGSWRALAHLHMHLLDWPLPVAHQYRMTVDSTDRLVHSLAHMSPKALKAVPNVSSARAPQLAGAAVLLRAVARHFHSSDVVVSAYGLREGIFFQALPDDLRRQDPLLSAAGDLARRVGRAGATGEPSAGEALLAFTDPAFANEPAADRRIRYAAALLSDSSWRAHPDLRAEDGLNLALHGRWAGIDATGRAMLAAALWSVNGGTTDTSATAILDRLAPPAALARAHCWGLALRLGQRLAGGTAGLLADASLNRDSASLTLRLPERLAPLYVEAIARRHRTLAQSLGLQPLFATG